MTEKRSSIPPELRVRLYGWLATVFTVCMTVAAILVPTERWEKLGRFLTDPATAVALTALGGVCLTLYMRARSSPAAALLVILVASGSLQGCTPADWQAVGDIAKPVGKWGCLIARSLCSKGDDVACGVILAVCEGFDAITSGGEEEGTGPRDAEDAEPHDLDAEP